MKNNLLLLLCFISFATFAQEGVSISSNGADPDPSAILDIASSDRGLLIPRMTASQRLAIDTPATGLLIYQTDQSEGFWYFDGADWVQGIGPEGPAGSAGPAGTPAPGNAPGDMLYWNGSEWSLLPGGSYGQGLFYCGGIPSWGGCPPQVSTDAVIPPTTFGGNVTNDGGSAVTDKGVCYSTSPNPTIADPTVSGGSGTGAFSMSVSGLSPSTLYYVRAYATNSNGTSYGSQVSYTTPQYLVGQSFGGGVIFYVDGSGQHGLISATADQSTNAIWGCSGTNISTSVSVGSGQTNTNAIVSGCATAGIAAKICDALSLNGYTDWFLPSKGEINLMHQQRTLIGGFPGSDFAYWSSSQEDNNNAWVHVFPQGNIGGNTKGSSGRVRAIRAF